MSSGGYDDDNHSHNNDNNTVPTLAIFALFALACGILLLIYLYFVTSKHKTKMSRPLVSKRFENVQTKYKFASDATATIGRGCFGVVRKCQHWRTKRTYACKTIPKSSTPSETLVREVTNLQKINSHPYIISLVDVYEDVKFIHLITEPCWGGELYDRILENPNAPALNPFTDEDFVYIIRNILLAIAYMHTAPQNIVHRDLKASNFLFLSQDDNQTIKIIDFGLSKYVPSTTTTTTGVKSCELCRNHNTCGNKHHHDREPPEHKNDNLEMTGTFESILEEEEVDDDDDDDEDSDHNEEPERSDKVNVDTNEEDLTTTTTEQEQFLHSSNMSMSDDVDYDYNCDCDCHLGRMKSKVGTPYYVAPEILKEESYTNKCDVWSIGCIAYFILTKNLPFQGTDEKETLKILERYYDDNTTIKLFEEDEEGDAGDDDNDKKDIDVWDRLPLAKDFVQCLLQSNPLKRPSAVTALNHPFLVEVCGRPPSDLRGDDEDDDEHEDLLPRWGAVTRLGARIGSDNDVGGPESERSPGSDSQRSGLFGLFRKVKSSFQ